MKKYILSLSLGLLALQISFAQPMTTSTPDAMQKKAEEAESTNNPYAALELYDKVYDDTKDKNILIKLAQLNYDLRDYEDAERRLSRLVLKDRKKENGELRFLYAQCLKYNGKYDDAIEQFKIYASEGQNAKQVERCKIEIAGCELGQKGKQPENLLINNAGKKVNSPHGESSPSYSNGELYFVSLAAKEVIVLGEKGGDAVSQVYSSSRNGNEFGETSPLGTQINREDWWQGNVSISPDGNTMYFTRVEMDINAMKSSKIYFSQRGREGWGAANEVTGVNGEYIAKHPCEGELFGEKVLFFVANIPGGKGGDDIYYAQRKKDGVFGIPVNLGDQINSIGDEWSPFYKEGKLFFSTNGLESMGGMDVYESQWNGAIWSNPKPLPKGVNSSLDDFFYTQLPDGQSGYFVSNRPGPNNLKSKTCCDDIHTWEIERVKVNLAANTFRFKKKGEKENMPLEACTVQIFDVTDKNPVSVESKTNAKANDFAFILKPDRTYRLIADRNEYQSDTLTFNTVGVKKSTSIEKKLTLRRDKKVVEEPEPTEKEVIVKLNEPIRLNNIYYDLDKDNILPDAEDDLLYLSDLMNKYPEMKIELSSHTDAQGKDEYNQKLSQRRAESAKRWMVGRGIAENRIVPVGYGETQLLNECKNGTKCTDDQHRLNRRTEFKIIEGPTSIIIEKREKKIIPANEKKSEGTGTKPKTGGKQAANKWDSFFFLNSESKIDTIVPNHSEIYLETEVDLIGLPPIQEKIPVESTSEHLGDSTKIKVSSPHNSATHGKTNPKISAPVEVEKQNRSSEVHVENTKWLNPAEISMRFNREVFDFGKIKDGVEAHTLFVFTNTGNVPLEIEIVSACYCMNVSWTKDLIQPNEKGNIDVVFDSNDQVGLVKKDIDVIFKNTDKNGYPLIKRLTIKGKVLPK